MTKSKIPLKTGKLCILVILLLVAIQAFAQTMQTNPDSIPFAPAVNYGVGDNPHSVFCADLDGDTDLDLAVTNWNSGNVSILKNNGDGTFQKQPLRPAFSLGDHGLSTAAAKPAKVAGYRPARHAQAEVQLKQGGEDCASATFIPGLPYAIAGTTADYTDDYNEDCPYTGSIAPDVVYSYTPSANEVVNIDLYGSLYDTKVFVYENNCSPPAYACNDDYYPDYTSAILNLSLTSGNTYYIVIDGYDSSSYGDYNLRIATAEPCSVQCPPEGIPEGEPSCGTDYLDTYNSGCGGNPISFVNISCNTKICGTSGTFLYSGLNYRDTDWYRVVVSEPTILSWSVVAEFPVLIILIDAGSEDCVDYQILNYDYANPCDTATISVHVPAGVYWPWVAPWVFDWFPCVLKYVAAIRCGTCGDCNKDGMINSADVTYLINYLFVNGPAPQPLEAGDANCDGTINSADVSYLINYLFVGGPPPGC
jgi:hypothetical protein